MKQILASVFFDILSILLRISFFVIIITAKVYKLRLAEDNFLSCFYSKMKHQIHFLDFPINFLVSAVYDQHFFISPLNNLRMVKYV